MTKLRTLGQLRHRSVATNLVGLLHLITTLHVPYILFQSSINFTHPLAFITKEVFTNESGP